MVTRGIVVVAKRRAVGGLVGVKRIMPACSLLWWPWGGTHAPGRDGAGGCGPGGGRLSVVASLIGKQRPNA